MSRPARPRAIPLILLGFAGVQVAIVLLAANGPFLDEGVYATAGLRVLQGFGFEDGYLAWFAGSPFLWPVFSAAGYAAAGLPGSRLVALAFSLATLGAFARAVENLFGRRAAAWATLGLALNGLFVALAHFAVYDVLALACLSVAFWLVTEHLKGGRESLVVAAALAFALGVIAKYGYVIMGAPLLGLLATGPDRARRSRAAVLFGGLSALALLAVSFALFGRPIPGAIQNYNAHPRVFTRSHLLFTQLHFVAVPLLLAVWGGGIVWRRGRRWLALVLVGALFIAPAFHLYSRNHVSAQKHVVMGFLLAYPLAGVALERLRESRARWLSIPALAALLGWGGVQWYAQERSWPDVRPVADYLRRHVEPGERIASYSSWSYAMDLYWGGRIRAPLDVQDRRTIEERHGDLCTYDWLVGEKGGWLPQGDPVVQAALACGAEPVFTTSTWTLYGSDHGWLRRGTGEISVFRRRASEPGPTDGPGHLRSVGAAGQRTTR